MPHDLIELLPLLGQTGFVGIIAYFGYKLHMDAVRTHDKRAEEWKRAAEKASERADVRDQQIAHILSAVPDKESKGQR